MTLVGFPRTGQIDLKVKKWLEKLPKEVLLTPVTTSISNSDITMLGGGTATSGSGERFEMQLGNSSLFFVWCYFTVNLTSVAGTTGIKLPISNTVAAVPDAACFPYYNGVGTRLRFLRAQADPGAATFTIAPISYDNVPNNYAFYTGSQSFNGVFLYKAA